MGPIATFALAGGVLALLASWKDWSWFFGSSKAWLIVNIVGRKGARVFYAALGVAMLFTSALFLFGILPDEYWKKLGPGYIIVTAAYPGASADVVAATVGHPIEQYIDDMLGLHWVASESRNDGSYRAIVCYDRDSPGTRVDPQTALIRVQTMINLSMPLLPKGVEPVVVIQGNEASEQVTIAILASEGPNALPPYDLARAVVRRIEQEGALRTVEPVALATERRLNLNVDRRKLDAMGLSMHAIGAAMKAATPDAEPEALRQLLIATSEGESVPLGEVSEISVAMVPRIVCRVNLKPAIKITGLSPEHVSHSQAARRCIEIAQEERKAVDFQNKMNVLDLTP
jgi:multidrug efflux pump subunit AcrB